MSINRELERLVGDGPPADHPNHRPDERLPLLRRDVSVRVRSTLWRPVISTELPCTRQHALRIEPERIQGDDGDPVTTQLDFLQLRVIPLLARELELVPEVLVPSS